MVHESKAYNIGYVTLLTFLILHSIQVWQPHETNGVIWISGSWDVFQGHALATAKAVMTDEFFIILDTCLGLKIFGEVLRRQAICHLAQRERGQVPFGIELWMPRFKRPFFTLFDDVPTMSKNIVLNFLNTLL